MAGRAIRVSGVIYIDEGEFDPGPNGPLTEDAYLRYSSEAGMDDLEFEDLGPTGIAPVTSIKPE